jgi:hypothetical protein
MLHSHSLVRAALFAATLLCGALSGRAEPAPSAPPPLERAGGAHYAHLFGERYRTRVDLYLFMPQDDLDHVYLGRNDGTPSTRLPQLPVSVDQVNVGKQFGEFLIVDVVPAGSELRLTAETHEVTALSRIREQGGYPMGLLGVLTYRGHEAAGVSCEFIQSATKAPPRTANQTIDSAQAEKIKAEATARPTTSTTRS